MRGLLIRAAQFQAAVLQQEPTLEPQGEFLKAQLG
jgi:hypothetical protein